MPNPKPKLLVVDDDVLVRRSLRAVLEGAGYAVTDAAGVDEAVRLFETEKPDLVLSDVRLPDAGGEQLLMQVKARSPATPVLMMTAYGSIESAVHAMKLGAKDYLGKPINDWELLQRIGRALEELALKRDNARLRDKVPVDARIEGFVGSHPTMQPILQIVSAVAPTRATVLIRGESGTGKTMLARLIHALSDRAHGPFIEVSCGALPDPLLESELFGYEKGAFTGAERARTGKFEAAQGGTLFLDEIANATPALQSKLLRILQDRAFERLGGNEVLKADVRLVLATNADLEALVKDGKFREDLYYRINVVSMRLPNLRDRMSDLPALARHFAQRFSAEHRKLVQEIDPAVFEAFQTHEWPGNVRELENVIEHAVLLSKEDRIGLDALPARPFQRDGLAGKESAVVRPLREALEEPEREYIRRVLRINRGNRQKTADMLEVTRTTLFYKMKKYGLFEERSWQ